MSFHSTVESHSNLEAIRCKYSKGALVSFPLNVTQPFHILVQGKQNEPRPGWLVATPWNLPLIAAQTDTFISSPPISMKIDARGHLKTLHSHKQFECFPRNLVYVPKLLLNYFQRCSEVYLTPDVGAPCLALLPPKAVARMEKV